MSPDSIEAELQTIEAVVAEAAAGLSRSEIEQRCAVHGVPMETRTLQRRLRRLVEQSRLVARGRGSATRYLLPAHPLATEEPEIDLSADAAEVRALVRRPIARRVPVGYRRDWLEHYEPGVTWYLPVDVRERLAKRGETPDPDRAAGTHAREMLEHLLIDLSWASSRLEGNTYSRLDTANLIEFGQQAEGKDATEAQMVLNHKRAIEFLVDNAETADFNRWTLLTLHALLAENLVGDPAEEGRLRRRMVQIMSTTYTPPAIPQVIEECFDTILSTARAIHDPFEQAFFAMVHLPYLQPFVDANKRTSRLAANLPLIKANLFPLSFVDVPRKLYIDAIVAVYEERRIELLRDLFVWAYERSCDQYRVVRDAIVAPDPIRLRYAEEIAEVIRGVVDSNEAPSRRTIRARAALLDVDVNDVEEFTERTLQVLVGLNEGVAGRYGIPLAKYFSWRRSHARDGDPS